MKISVETWRSTFGQALSVERGEGGCQGLENSRAEADEVELALAAGFNNAGGLKLFYVVRERGGSDGNCFKHLGATHGSRRIGDALEEFIPAGIRESFKDRNGAFGA